MLENASRTFSDKMTSGGTNRKGWWASTGIPEEEHFKDLFFSASTSQIIAAVARPEKDFELESLYSRHISEKRYKRLTPRSKILTYRQPILPARAPYVFVNVLKASRTGGDWIAVTRIDLRTRACVDVVQAGRLAGMPASRDCWVSHLRNASDDGGTIYCSIGLKGDITGPLEYWLCALSVKTGSLRKLSKQEGLFL